MTPTLIDRIRPRPGPTAPALSAVRALARLLGTVALIGLAVTALRGRLPPDSPRAAGTGGGSAVAVLAALVSMSAVVLVLALVARARAGPSPRLAIEHESRRLRGHRWSRRDLVWIAAAAVVLTGALLLPVVGRMAVTPMRQPSSSQTSQTSRTSPPADHPDMTAESRPPRPGGGAPWTVSLVALPTLLALMAAGALLGRRRTHLDEVPTESSAPRLLPGSGNEGLARAAELALAAVAEPQLDARSAIIACYTAMESALAGAGDAAPQESDTPTEVLARAVTHGVVREKSAGALVRLFTEARFSTHPMTEQHRALAVRLLSETLDDLTLDDLRNRACAP